MLIACQHPMDEIKDIIGADSLGYLAMEHLSMLVGSQSPQGYCDACFSGNYPTKEPIAAGKNRFEMKISEKGEVR